MKLSRSPRSVSQINGRPVLQPASNRNLTLVVDPSRTLLKKKLLLLPTNYNRNDKETATNLNSSTDKPSSPRTLKPISPIIAGVVGDLGRKKSKRDINVNHVNVNVNVVGVTAPGSLAAAQKEKATLLRAKRKMKIAHYGRAVAKGTERKVAPISTAGQKEEERCSFITSNSDPIYVRYHDEEWGVPVHDDKLLFELLVLSGAQVELNWATILKKRDAFRSAFAGFNAEAVSKLTEKQTASISAEYDIEIGRVRSIIDNSKSILKVTREFGSLNKYIWGFVNNKPISPQYRSSRKIPVKSSKSEAISKDMVRRGFRLVGPTVIYSFMQAAGLTNDHQLTCSRHSSVASSN